MSTIHMVLQGKCGVGKSMLATMLAQFKVSKGQTPVCIDTDPVNATLYGFKSLNVQRLDILNDDKNVDASKFDDLIEIISGTSNDVIIDNGASSFIPLSSYIVANDIASVFQDMGHQLFVHTVITGGQALPDTLVGFDALVRQFPDECAFVVWLNPYWGKVESEGLSFEEMKVYKNNADRVIKLVEIPIFTAETFGRDFSDMLKARRTFDEAINDKSLKIMQRQRLKIIQSKIFGELGNDSAQVLLYGY
ncbi:conjugal transfer protein TraL [Ventosimonas gracilis]|uniref:Conjugal transfer protein TraL n=1 Tax=Ventosimonas gracilis TaxID=1680762 RepID=A0A139SW78_9GAMM|nr:conjugal transfer protein TraL [Ventosimonas gracilis]KXU38682.1 conjugal transfer protein TraL [Ventosimonas gracilis]